MTTIREVLIETRDPQVAALAVAVHKLADEAWDKASAAHHSRELNQLGRDLEEAYARGRAHAFCEVLGDQTDLSFFIEDTEGQPTAAQNRREMKRLRELACYATHTVECAYRLNTGPCDCGYEEACRD